MPETSNTHCLWKGEHGAWGSVLGGSLTFSVCVFVLFDFLSCAYIIQNNVLMS